MHFPGSVTTNLPLKAWKNSKLKRPDRVGRLYVIYQEEVRLWAINIYQKYRDWYIETWRSLMRFTVKILEKLHWLGDYCIEPNTHRTETAINWVSEKSDLFRKTRKLLVSIAHASRRRGIDGTSNGLLDYMLIYVTIMEEILVAPVAMEYPQGGDSRFYRTLR